MLCLIFTHSPSGAVRPRALCVYIRQSTLACVITITYYIYIYICNSYNTGTRALPDIYARCPRASAYISGKARAPVL